MNEQGLTALMLADTDVAPPARIDLGEVVRAGRRRRRRRAVMAPAVAMLIVVALGAGMMVTARAWRDGSGSPPAAALTGEPAPAEFTMSRLEVTATWIPYGLVPRAPVLSPFAQRLPFVQTEGDTIVAGIDVTLYAAGVLPWQLTAGSPGGAPLTATSAPPVNGRTAQWYTDGARSVQALAFAWATDGWAVVSGHIPGADPRVFLREIAVNLRLHDQVPVVVGFTMARPAPPWQLQSLQPNISTNRGPGITEFADAYTVDFVYGPGRALPSTISPAGWPPDARMVVTKQRPAQVRDPSPNTTIGGHPAYVPSNQDFRVVLYDVSGYRVEVWINDANSAQTQASRDLATAWALTVTAGGPDPDSAWSSTPFR